MVKTESTQIVEGDEERASISGAPAVVCRNVGKSFGLESPVLQGVNLEIAPGEFVAILGRSGSGKSTLLRLLADLSPVTEGEILIDGNNPSQFLSRTAFVFQDPTLLPWKRVLENVTLPLKLMGMPKPERRELALHWLEKVGLQGVETRFPRQLSGGMRMRVSLARMLVRQPDMILYDEPFSALDEISRQRLNELISGLYAQHRKTSLFVTHSVAEALFLAGRIWVLGDKPARIVGDFRLPWDFPRSPELRATAEFARWTERVSKCLWEATAENGGSHA